MRDRLIELIKNAPVWKNGTFDEACEFVADHLIENGVIVPPCKVGDTVYWVENNTEIKSGKVRQLGYEDHIWLVVDVSKTKCVVLSEEREIFLTKEEAEKALRGEGE